KKSGGFGRRFAAFAVLCVVAFRYDPLQTDEAIAFVEADQTHALRVAALDRNVADGRAHERTARADQHDLVVLLDLHRADHASVALGRLQGDDALAAAAMNGV